MAEIKGVVYGKITETMRKESNKSFEPWKCFSLILKKRTLDIYCEVEEKDIQFWLPGISYCLRKAYTNDKYAVKGVVRQKMLKASDTSFLNINTSNFNSIQSN